jgi:hypothetical protein
MENVDLANAMIAAALIQSGHERDSSCAVRAARTATTCIFVIGPLARIIDTDS